MFFWIVYYFVKKYYDELISYVYKKQQKRNQKKFKRSKFLKKQQAITEIKEAKELVDLGILSKEEYDELSKKLKPIILDNEPLAYPLLLALLFLALLSMLDLYL